MFITIFTLFGILGGANVAYRQIMERMTPDVIVIPTLSVTTRDDVPAIHRRLREIREQGAGVQSRQCRDGIKNEPARDRDVDAAARSPGRARAEGELVELRCDEGPQGNEKPHQDVLPAVPAGVLLAPRTGRRQAP